MLSEKIMNGNGTELQQARFTHIEHRRCGAAVDREDLHQILILTLNLYFSLSRFHSSLRRRAAKRLLDATPGPLFHTSKTGSELTVSCVNKSPNRYGCQPKSYAI